MQNDIIITITAPSGSGKTQIANAIIETMGRERCNKLICVKHEEEKPDTQSVRLTFRK